MLVHFCCKHDWQDYSRRSTRAGEVSLVQFGSVVEEWYDRTQGGGAMKLHSTAALFATAQTNPDCGVQRQAGQLRIETFRWQRFRRPALICRLREAYGVRASNDTESRCRGSNR